MRRSFRLGIAGLLALAALGLVWLAFRAGPRAVPALRPEASEHLSASGRRAIAALRAHQRPAGFWGTTFTPQPVYVQPALEVNVSVPALIIDLLDPIAVEAGLADTVELGRGFLRDQIEPSGLVRYHGLPTAGYIRPRPCAAITPDADDTALVWRIAPAEPPAGLAPARATLARFRNESGLYRTWLADPADYECLDPGVAPNPADVAINQHLYLFFARYDPEEARRLCAVLQAAIGDDRIWVYYKAAPLVPLLRTVDLGRAGCVLRVPEERLRSAPVSQRPYLTLGLLYRALLLPGEAPPPYAAVERALEEIARGEFRLLRETPPLLYHNDVTGNVPRYYWSEDAGYALWLRVLAATADLARRAS